MRIGGKWKILGKSGSGSRNRMLRILATNATNAVPIGTRNTPQTHPDGLRTHPSGELATANFREFLFHALR
jgi:hypothetical protein